MDEIKKYQIIYADPPWRYSEKLNVKTNGKEIYDHYPTMKNEDIIALPVKDVADKSCMLFLWTTYAHLEIALHCINNWGFKYKTVAFEWFKKTTNGKPVCFMGHYTCGGAIELCLLAKRGNIKRIAKNIRRLVISERLKHSQKPEEVKDRIKLLYGDLPRIELFARQKTEGWDVWGNEVESDITLITELIGEVR